MAGQLWTEDMPDLPNADETHAVASHNWIWIKTKTAEKAYLFPQKTVVRDNDTEDYAIVPAELRTKISSKWMDISGVHD